MQVITKAFTRGSLGDVHAGIACGFDHGLSVQICG